MPRRWYDAEVIKIIQETPTVRRFWLDMKCEDSFDFLPGQFITMDLPLGEKRLERWRSYSIASRPDGSSIIELCIVLLDGGKATNYLFNHISVGSTIRCKGPDGGFVLPSGLDERELVMVCTGTGVAPFRSMIQAVLQGDKRFRGMHLIFGCRTEEDILYRKEFEHWAKAYDNFSYDIALSRAEWNGRQGYVHDIYLEHYAEPTDSRLFLLCGWTAMVDEAVANIIASCKYKPSQVKYELYG